MNILIDTNFELNNKQIAKFENMGHTLVDTKGDVHYWVTSSSKSNKNHLQYPNLKYVQLASAGFDTLDMEALQKRNIKVMNARGIYSPAIAEYILSYILSIYKEHKHYKNLQEQNEWQMDLALETLNGKRVLFLGAGSIAQETARLLKSFGAYTIGLNSDGRKIDEFSECIELDKGIENIGAADIVISTLPANDATVHLLNYEVLKSMSSSSILINVGRGDVVDEKGLLKALDETIRFAVLDVFEEEPLPKTSKLWNHPKVIMTPHSSYSSPERNLRHVNLLFKQIKRINQGKEPINIISK